MINYAPFCKKQVEFIKRTRHSWLNVQEGGKRAGKNITNLASWAACIDKHPDKLHLAAGVSISAAKLNIIDCNGYGLKNIFAGRCIEKKYEDRDALRVMTPMGEKIILITGGGDIYSAAKIKGNSYGSVYVTEVNECHQTFVQEVFTRTLASNMRRVFFDLNPKAPAHWFYTEILDFYVKNGIPINGVNYGHFTVADNLSIDSAKLKELLWTYDRNSIWYQADILGLRTSASGRIYTSYSQNDVAVTREWVRKQNFIELSVGVDVGGTHATAATLSGLTQGWKELVHIDGMYHKQGLSDKMDEATYARMIVDWLIPWAKIYPALGTIYVDSAAKLFRGALQKEMINRGLSRFAVRATDKSDGINERIKLASMLFAQGRYKISDHMLKWHEAYQMATWSSDEYAKGEWVRTDDGSYPLDCLDSAEYSFYPLKRFLM